MIEPIKLWTIIDIQKKEPRYTYFGENTQGCMAIYDKKPTIPKEWKPFKKIIRVIVTPLINKL